MNRLVLLLVLILTIWGTGANCLEASIVELSPAMRAVPQEKVIEGPGEDRRTEREIELDESDFQSSDDLNPQSRKKIELILGIAFLLGVILIAFLRRGGRSR